MNGFFLILSYPEGSIYREAHRLNDCVVVTIVTVSAERGIRGI